VNILRTAHHPSPLCNIQDRIQNTEYKIQNTEYRTQNTDYRIQKLMYIRLPMYLFFYMELILNDLDGDISNSRAIGRGGP
jgi:hypothetical protein